MNAIGKGERANVDGIPIPIPPLPLPHFPILIHFPKAFSLAKSDIILALLGCYNGALALQMPFLRV